MTSLSRLDWTGRDGSVNLDPDGNWICGGVSVGKNGRIHIYRNAKTSESKLEKNKPTQN